jgi:tetratricopeptide (TPR) repeat protein
MNQFLLAAALLIQSPPPSQAVPDKIPWFSGSLEAAIEDAKPKNAIVLAFYRTDADPDCATMSRTTFSNDAVVAALSKVVCVRIEPRSLTPMASRIPLKKLPVLVWFNPDGSPRDRLDGLYDPEPFLAETSRIVHDIGTINDLRRRLADRKDDVDAHFALFQKLRSVGDEDGMNEQKAIILRLDPEGRSRARMRFAYDEITNAIEKHWAEKQTLPMDKIEDLWEFVELQDDPEILWDGWMRLANTHDYLEKQAAGKPEEAKLHRAKRRESLARAWRGVPQEKQFLSNWCHVTSEIYWSQRGELSEADKSFLLTLTQRSTQLFDKNPDAFQQRARALRLSGKREEAIAAARKAIELAPEDARYKKLLEDLQAP